MNYKYLRNPEHCNCEKFCYKFLVIFAVSFFRSQLVFIIP